MGTLPDRQKSSMSRVLPILRLLRPKHWVKNVFVLAPLFLAFRFNDLEAVIASLAGFAGFSLAASAVYVGNDIVDREKDRLHETKRYRPVASGRVSVPLALMVLVLLVAASVSMAFALAPMAGVITLTYLVLNTAYSLGLKNVVIIDVFVIAAGFVLRVWMGAEVIDVPVSQWTILITIFLSLFLGFSKRRNEIEKTEAWKHRGVLDAYSPDLLTIYIVMSAVLTITAYTFYTIDESITARFDPAVLIYSIPVVVFGLFRYMLLVIGRGEGGDVAELVTKDLPIVLSVIVWSGLLIWAHLW